MKYLPSVIDCKYVSGYKLMLTFDNGRVKLVDLKDRLRGGVFMPLRDINFFKRITLDGDTITWENGADIAPETLYEIGVDITPKPAKSHAIPHPHYDQERRKSA